MLAGVGRKEACNSTEQDKSGKASQRCAFHITFKQPIETQVMAQSFPAEPTGNRLQ